MQDNTATRHRAVSDAPSKLVNASKKAFEADVPLGMWSATAQKTSQAPTLADIRQARYSTDLEDRRGRRLGSSTDASHTNGTIVEERYPASSTDEWPSQQDTENDMPPKLAKAPTFTSTSFRQTDSGTYPNGYQFPPKNTWKQSFSIGLRAFFAFLKTPVGILIAIYGLNVVAWGAMIFFLLIGAASSEMCFVERDGVWVHDCNDLASPRRKWIEIDAQVLTALFCVTAFGLFPWRARDCFYALWWRFTGNLHALRKLAAWHRAWFRLPGSDTLDPTSNEPRGAHDVQYLPEPVSKAPDLPLTGVRAAPTKLWMMDFFVWSAMGNTLFQVILCYFMWAMNRFDRPSWATGLFVALGCGSAGLGGVLQFREGKRIKAAEGVPLEVGKNMESVERAERGIS